MYFLRALYKRRFACFKILIWYSNPIVWVLKRIVSVDDSFEYPQHRVCFNIRRKIVRKRAEYPLLIWTYAFFIWSLFKVADNFTHITKVFVFGNLSVLFYDQFISDNAILEILERKLTMTPFQIIHIHEERWTESEQNKNNWAAHQ